jgi:hypothetical protein
MECIMANSLKNLVASMVVLTACVSDPDSATTTASAALTGDNGISVNGISVNGISVNGTSLNGISVNGISVNGISVNGISVNGISVNGTSINGISVNGISVNGTDFIGAHLNAALSNGESLELRIDDVGALDGANADVVTYAVSAAVAGGWAPLCGYEADGSVKLALAVAGTWNLTTGAWSDTGEELSFACRHASVAKCVEFGYKASDGYADHHHACVRMLRADYCGDGTPHTVNGTPINLYDNASVQLDTEAWPVDAEWGPDGALCVNHTRGGSPPPCYAAKFSETCGGFASGALLIDEYNGQ